MDLGTTGIIVGIVAAAVYVIETACKYGSALYKKISQTASRSIFYSLSKKSSGRPPERSKKILTTPSRLRSQQGTSFATPSVIKGSYGRSTKVRPGYDIDLLFCHHGSSGLLKKP
jgi:hypothetical protein